MELVYGLDRKRLPDVTEVGGKALELIRMTQQGFPVPGGLVLTTAFFETWFAALGPDADKSACTGLRFSEAQREALSAGLKALARTDGADPLFAVRSSSPEEDLVEASFAGGYETILGVTETGLEAAVVRCFASYFDERVQVYKQKQGIAPGSRRHAVIIQAQINPGTAGVAFSINPVNNCYDEAVINANYGLGESVVSGDAEPDYFVVDKVHGKILQRRVGSKTVSVSLGAAGGTVVHEHTTSQAACISDETALQISGLLQRVESRYGCPIDIEWAIAGDNLFLLQVRPITTHFQLPPEMITPPGEPKKLYANSTLIEQGLQEPLSVLGAEFVQYVLRSMARAMGGDMVGPEGTTFTAGGRYYTNMSYAIKMSGKKMAFAPGSMGDETLKEMLDQVDLTEYLPAELPDRLRRMRRRALFSVAPLVLPTLHAYLRPEAFVRKFQANLPAQVRKFDLPADCESPLSDQAAYLTGLLDFFNIRYGIPLVLAGQLAQLRIKRLFETEERAIRDALANLGAALPGNKTAEMGALMHRLAAAPEIRTTETAEHFFQKLQSKAYPDALVRDWNRLVEEFGIRCPAEIDVATPRPGENPAVLFDQLKTLSLGAAQNSDPFAQAKGKREAAYRTLYEAAQSQSARKARAFARYYEVWSALGGYREMPKHYIVRAVAAFRTQALARAQEFVRQGRLDRPEQIFDMTMADIEEARQNPGLDLRDRARERSAFINRARACKLVVRMVDSRGKIFYPAPKGSTDRQLAGLSISAGVVRGRVKVLRTATEKRLLPGEILVARATDPGWTPLFINAGGIILEIGGVLQHGAVVAREYGIPCVSGISRATEILQDGQLVELDASNGIVRLLQEGA